MKPPHEYAVQNVRQSLVLLAGANTPATATIVIDQTALVFSIALSIATGVLFGFAPALQTAKVDVAAAINDGGRGVAGALAMSRALGALLFGISATDPLPFVLAAAALTVAALAAAYAPARRAGRIDPVVLLR